MPFGRMIDKARFCTCSSSSLTGRLAKPDGIEARNTPAQA